MGKRDPPEIVQEIKIDHTIKQYMHKPEFFFGILRYKQITSSRPEDQT